MQASQRALRVLCPRVQVRSFSRSSARLEKAVAGARVAQNYFNDEVREALANPPAPSNPGEKYSFAIGSGMRELPSNEEIEAHFGHLLLPENTVANGLSLEVNALQNVNVLKCLAEFNSTEYQLKFPEKRVIQPDLSLGVELFQIYGNQLQNFENNTLPALQADGVPKVTQDLLHSIYKFRADTPVPEIATHILEIGINRLKMFNQEYVFRKSLYEPILGPLERFWFAKPPRNKAVPTAVAIQQLKGFRAFTSALFRLGEKGSVGGLTQEEVKHVYSVLSLAATGELLDNFYIPPSNLDQDLDDKIEQAIASSDPAGALNSLRSQYGGTIPTAAKRMAFMQLTMRTIEYQNKQKLASWKAAGETPTTEVTTTEGTVPLPLDLSPERISEIKSQTLAQLNEALKADPQKKNKETKLLDNLSKVVGYFFEPEVVDLLKLAQLMAQAGRNLTDDLKSELVRPFLEKFPQKDFPDDLARDIVTTHPLADRLFTNRMDFLARDDHEYTKYYEEGTESLYHVNHDVYKEEGIRHIFKDEEIDRSNASSLRKAAKTAKKRERSDRAVVPEVQQLPDGYPFNSGTEEVMHLKLEALATNVLGFDLDNEVDYLMFENFCNSYDISPGEDTLDRCHSYPPPEHTYEELPIIKKDGWAECDTPTDYPEYIAFLEQEGKQAEH